MDEGAPDREPQVTVAVMKDRTKRFALRVLKLTRALPGTPEAQAVRRQLVRSGTSVAANYRSAQRARSKPEFRSRMTIVQEEADETCFWLEVIQEDGMLPKQKVRPLYEEANELLRIVTAVCRSASPRQRP